MNMLEISHLSKKFADKQVLTDLNLTVPEKSIYGFVGQNGVGKTTTMKIILGLLAADGGEIRVNGELVSFGENRTNQFCGYLPDVPEFYSFMTPKEYLRFCGEITGMDSLRSKSRADELLALVGLDKEKHRIKGFSRGMKQRLGIAQALLNQPKLLICDEPTSALDPVGRKEILDILVAAKEQTTILFSTHILSDVERICDEIAFLHKGKIMFSGNREKMQKMHKADGFEIETEHSEDTDKLLGRFSGGEKQSRTLVVFEKGNEEQMQGMLAHIVREQIAVRRIEKREATLESVFMEVVGK